MTLPNASFRSLCLAGGLAALVLPASMQATILGPEEFARLDTNKDGVVSAAENAAGARAIFRQVDANRDDVVVASYHGDHGHPIVLARRLAERLVSERKSESLREFIAEHAEGRRYLDCDDPAVVGNVNTPEAYEALRQPEESA